MSYITNSDVQLRLGNQRYIELTDDDGTGSANPAVADEARNAAEGEVNAALSQRYRVPIDLTAHPELAGLLQAAALDLVEHRLHARRRDIPPDVSMRRTAVVDFLNRIAAGVIALPSIAPLAPGEPSGPRTLTTGERRTLSRDELADF